MESSLWAASCRGATVFLGLLRVRAFVFVRWRVDGQAAPVANAAVRADLLRRLIDSRRSRRRSPST